MVAGKEAIGTVEGEAGFPDTPGVGGKPVVIMINPSKLSSKLFTDTEYISSGVNAYYLLGSIKPAAIVRILKLSEVPSFIRKQRYVSKS